MVQRHQDVRQVLSWELLQCKDLTCPSASTDNDCLMTLEHCNGRQLTCNFKRVLDASMSSLGDCPTFSRFRLATILQSVYQTLWSFTRAVELHSSQ